MLCPGSTSGFENEKVQQQINANDVSNGYFAGPGGTFSHTSNYFGKLIAIHRDMTPWVMIGFHKSRWDMQKVQWNIMNWPHGNSWMEPMKKIHGQSPCRFHELDWAHGNFLDWAHAKFMDWAHANFMDWAHANFMDWTHANFMEWAHGNSWAEPMKKPGMKLLSETFCWIKKFCCTA